MAQFQPTNITPSSRSYSPGEYPQNEFQALNGVKTVIRYGKYRYNSTLTLGFNNITDEQAWEIIDNYRQVNSVYNYVVFSSDRGLAGVGVTGHTSTSGALTNLATYMAETSTAAGGQKWRYDGPPTVTSVFPGRSNVECKFVACLDSPQNIMTV